MSVALEAIKRLETAFATIERLARRRAELAQPTRRLRPAAGTRGLGVDARRGDPVLTKLSMPLGADPVAAPRRRELIVRARFLEAPPPERPDDGAKHHRRPGAAPPQRLHDVATYPRGRGAARMRR